MPLSTNKYLDKFCLKIERVLLKLPHIQKLTTKSEHDILRVRGGVIREIALIILKDKSGNPDTWYNTLLDEYLSKGGDVDLYFNGSDEYLKSILRYLIHEGVRVEMSSHHYLHLIDGERPGNKRNDYTIWNSSLSASDRSKFGKQQVTEEDPVIDLDTDRLSKSTYMCWVPIGTYEAQKYLRYDISYFESGWRHRVKFNDFIINSLMYPSLQDGCVVTSQYQENDYDFVRLAYNAIVDKEISYGFSRSVTPNGLNLALDQYKLAYLNKIYDFDVKHMYRVLKFQQRGFNVNYKNIIACAEYLLTSYGLRIEDSRPSNSFLNVDQARKLESFDSLPKEIGAAYGYSVEKREKKQPKLPNCGYYSALIDVDTDSDEEAEKGWSVVKSKSTKKKEDRARVQIACTDSVRHIAVSDMSQPSMIPYTLPRIIRHTKHQYKRMNINDIINDEDYNKFISS